MQPPLGQGSEGHWFPVEVGERAWVARQDRIAQGLSLQGLSWHPCARVQLWAPESRRGGEQADGSWWVVVSFN